jgi:hypothetical protein
MRKVTREIVDAFYSGVTKKVQNTRTDGRSIWLFDHKIAEVREGELWITSAGWKTMTTRERLNGLRGVSVSTRRGVWYLNGDEWNGEWVSVSNHLVDIVPDEVEFDVTSEWLAKERYSRPLYSVFHTLNKHNLDAVEELFDDALIPSRRMESDTAGEYKPHYYIIVMPSDVERAVRVLSDVYCLA